MKITVHARKSGVNGEHTGYIRVHHEGGSYTVSTKIKSLNKQDAIHEAAWLSESFNHE